MRTAVFSTALLALLALAPAAPADTSTGGTYGVAVGDLWDAGNWNTYWWSWKGTGPVSINLTWTSAGADYDLLLYPPGAIDDGVLDEEPIAEASARSSAVRKETISLPSLPANVGAQEYVLAIVAHHATGETYRLTTPEPGVLVKNLGPVVGVRGYCPMADCPVIS